MKKLVLLISVIGLVLGFSGCGKTNEAMYKVQLELANKQLPAQLEDGIYMTSMVDEVTDLVCYCEVDEDIYEMDLVEEAKHEIKAEVLENLQLDSDTEALVDLILSVDRGLIYRYKGDKTGKTVDIVVTIEELKSLKQGK